MTPVRPFLQLSSQDHRGFTCRLGLGSLLCGFLLVVSVPVVTVAEEISYSVDVAMQATADSASASRQIDETELDALGALLLGEASLTLQAEKPLTTLRALQRRAAADEQLFMELLRSRGFYDATVAWTTTLGGDHEAGDPFEVVFEVDPGPVYLLTAYRLHGLPEPALEVGEPKGLLRLGIKIDTPASAAMVVAGDKKLVSALRNRGFPFAEIVDRDVVVDHALRSMEVDLTVLPGSRARYGAVEVIGHAGVEEKFIRRRMTLDEGKQFDPADIRMTRLLLIESGVFASVAISYDDMVDGEGLLPMQVTVTEGKPRTIGSGLRFSSDEGLGVAAYWEHRNILGGAQKLRVESDWSMLGLDLITSYREPDFLQKDQSLLLEVQLASDDTVAYRSDRLRTSAGLERPLTERLVAGYGLSFEQSTEEGQTQNENFTLVGLPLYLSYDSSDNLLDPTTGQRTTLSLTPYVDPLDNQTSFLSAKLSERIYLGIGEERRFVVAGRFAIGAISGAPLSAVPLSKRFYSGGADSVRGYDYQLIGPLDLEDPDGNAGARSISNDPTGGLSVVQGGIELRWRIGENLGIAPFIEGAAVSENPVPDLGGDFLVGAGIGGRYYTVAGPVRLDIAFPLNGRDGIDDSFEFYLSLGQSF